MYTSQVEEEILKYSKKIQILFTSYALKRMGGTKR